MIWLAPLQSGVLVGKYSRINVALAINYTTPAVLNFIHTMEGEERKKKKEEGKKKKKDRVIYSTCLLAFQGFGTPAYLFVFQVRETSQVKPRLQPHNRFFLSLRSLPPLSLWSVAKNTPPPSRAPLDDYFVTFQSPRPRPGPR